MTIPLRPRTIRTRLTLLYAALFLGFGLALLAGAALLVFRGPILVTFAPTLSSSPATGRSVLPPLPTPAALRNLALVPTGGTVRALMVEASIALILTVACSAALGWFVAGRALRPLRVIEATTRRVSEHNLHERLGLTGPRDEVKQLADTIDGLLARLEAAFEAQRRFIANASHELRTPLTMMRTSVDVAVAKPPPIPPQVVALATKLYEGLGSAERLLEGLLTLARAHNGLTEADKAPVDLAALVCVALEGRSALIAEQALTVRREGTDVSPAADPHLLASLVENLVDNAVRHNEPGGWLRIATSAEGGAAVVTVENGGRRLRQEEVDQLGRPFQRLGAQRTAANGHGLGLSIAAAIAEAHGGELRLTARSEGGMKARVRI
jgi:signal transduction histidine kinase